jgi:L-glutamine-phosphate cytidylyltransferase
MVVGSMSSPKHAILIAAGRGRRLGPHTEEIAKGMVDIGAHPIIGWQWRALQAAGITDVTVIRGYKADVLSDFITNLLAPSGARIAFVDNHDWQTNNVLLSLAQARDALNQATLLLYSDIIFTPAVACAAAASPHDIALVIDREFRSIYEGRTEHPLDEGEVADLFDDGRVRRVGKRALSPHDAVGEFIGLVKLSAHGAAVLRQRIDQLLIDFAGAHDRPYQRAATFRNSYLTDVLQDLIDQGVAVQPVLIEGQWREIDTPQDLARATELVCLAKEWQ